MHDSEGVIQAIRARASDFSLLDEDEAPPSAPVVDTAIDFVRGLYGLSEVPPPVASVGTFFGELSLTWRSSGRIVRLAFFPGRPAMLTSGASTDPVGSYRTEANPTQSEVAARLSVLSPALV
jgi:hypothetical protein